MFAAIFMLFAAACFGQASKPSSGSVNKANARPTSSPSPTPTPIADADTATAAAVDSDNDTLRPDGDIITIETQLVSLPVRVMDKKGRFAAGLKKEDFSVTENGEKQDIEMFANEASPFTVVLMLDMSYSTTFKISEIQEAAIQFIDQLRPQDKVMVVSFDDNVHILCEATGDRELIYKAIRSTKIDTGTSLYEAFDTVINDRLRKVQGRKAIILFTDGVDTSSRRVDERSNLSDAMELDALVYPIRYDTFADVQAMKNHPRSAPGQRPVLVGTDQKPTMQDIMRSGTTVMDAKGTTAEDYQKAAEYLSQLADRTGGRLYEAQTLLNLSDAYRRIASELREFYSIGYYPKTERKPGQRANVKVKVAQEGLVVRARDIYIARKTDTKIK